MWSNCSSCKLEGNNRLHGWDDDPHIKEKNKIMMQPAFDFLDFGPSESVRLLQSLDMKSPLLFTKN